MAVTVYGWAAALMPGAGESRRNLACLAGQPDTLAESGISRPGRAAAATGRNHDEHDALPCRAGAIYWLLTQADRNLFSEAMADH